MFLLPNDQIKLFMEVIKLVILVFKKLNKLLSETLLQKCKIFQLRYYTFISQK